MDPRINKITYSWVCQTFPGQNSQHTWWYTQVKLAKHVTITMATYTVQQLGKQNHSFKLDAMYRMLTQFAEVCSKVGHSALHCRPNFFEINTMEQGYQERGEEEGEGFLPHVKQFFVMRFKVTISIFILWRFWFWANPLSICGFKIIWIRNTLCFKMCSCEVICRYDFFNLQ